jgi:HEAT repeat protein
VAIRASSSSQIAALVADLSASSPVTRDAAIARLTVMGSRAVERLIAVASSPDNIPARIAALRTLDAIGDPRALQVALRTLRDARVDPDVAVAAAGVARPFVRGAKGAAAVDGLTTAALDTARPAGVRIAALRALGDLDRTTLAPLLAALASDADASVRSAAAGASSSSRSRPRVPPADVLIRAADEALPADASVLRHAIAQGQHDVPLPALLRIVERVREREAKEPVPRRPEWTAVRATAHLALANRGSRLGVYDLRESIAAAEAPLPVEFLAALSIIGDASCLEAIAIAHDRATDGLWRDHLADAFGSIVARERLTGRHAVMKKIAKRFPALVARQ